MKNSAVVNPIPNKIYDVTITFARDGVVVFTDASLQREKEKASIGMVAIDSCGHLLHAFGSPIQFVGKAITVEALAIREAVERALRKGCEAPPCLDPSHTVVARHHHASSHTYPRPEALPPPTPKHRSASGSPTPTLRQRRRASGPPPPTPKHRSASGSPTPTLRQRRRASGPHPYPEAP
uniref:RNase H type-1 domain-containing protein n=1 Tax=Solanum tuberosum TaxID=4113 RepID=M1B4Y7_SOLTU